MPDESASKTRVRSPAYPTMALPDAITKLHQLFQAEHLTAAAVDVVATAWGYQPSSSAGPAAISALKQYGLLEDVGRGGDRRLRISGLGKEIVIEEQHSEPWRKAIQRAALYPTINADLWREFGRRGSDANIRSHLLRRDFNPKAVNGFIRDYRATVEFAALDETAIIPGDEAAADQVDASNSPAMSPTTAPSRNTEISRLHFDPTPMQAARPSGLPLPVVMDDGSVSIVNIPHMTGRSFDFFKAMLDTYRAAIVREPTPPPNESASKT